MCWNSGYCCHCTRCRSVTHTFVFCYGNGARKLENNQYENQEPVFFIYVETSKTFHLPAFHTANGWPLAEPHNSSLQSQNLDETPSLVCFMCLCWNLEYFTWLLSIHVALNGLKYYAAITDDDNCRSKIACKIIIIKKLLPEAEIT